VSCLVEFAVLGPLEVRVEGRPVQVRGKRQRALLAALLLRPGTVVPVDRLIDEVFGDVPPGQARNALQTYVARLRSALGPAAGLIVTRPPGYLLDAPREAVDAERFTELAASARDAYSPVAALGLLEQALALWRGAALAEFGGTFARGAALRLDGLRLTAREDHAALLLRAGRAAEAVAGLEALVEEEPWRERAVQLLVTAMAREGRTAGALAAYGRYRDRLRDDLGLDPSPGLRHLEQQVLAGEVQRGPWGPAAARRPAPPPRRTAFFGRDRELSSLHELLADGRLVSLVGTGGVGKTRLAREAVSGDDPVWWADLAALRDGEAVPNAVASAAGIDLQPGTPLLDMLRGWARSTSGCLILDNCEHLLAPAARLTEELLAESSRVRMLATSREPLGVHDERVFVVRPLDVPAPGDADSAQPAVRLFLDRARAAGAELATDPNTSNAPEISAAPSTGCRWPSNSPPPGQPRSPSTTSPRGSAHAWTCSGGNAAATPGIAAFGPSWTGRSACCHRRNNASFCGCRYSPRHSTSPRPRRSWLVTICPLTASLTSSPASPTGPC
jgi:DNA-binding SARP family transcriptional activator